MRELVLVSLPSLYFNSLQIDQAMDGGKTVPLPLPITDCRSIDQALDGDEVLEYLVSAPPPLDEDPPGPFLLNADRPGHGR